MIIIKKNLIELKDKDKAYNKPKFKYKKNINRNYINSQNIEGIILNFLLTKIIIIIYYLVMTLISAIIIL